MKQIFVNFEKGEYQINKNAQATAITIWMINIVA